MLFDPAAVLVDAPSVQRLELFVALPIEGQLGPPDIPLQTDKLVVEFFRKSPSWLRVRTEKSMERMSLAILATRRSISRSVSWYLSPPFLRRFCRLRSFSIAALFFSMRPKIFKLVLMRSAGLGVQWLVAFRVGELVQERFHPSAPTR